MDVDQVAGGSTSIDIDEVATSRRCKKRTAKQRSSAERTVGAQTGQAGGGQEIDPEFVIMNWDKLKEMDDNDLFFESYDPDKLPLGRSNTIDNKINLANNFQLMKSLMTYNYNSMPIYMNGRNDWLIQLDAIGLRDIVNYNVMLRKSYTINIQNHWLTEDYNKLPTGIQLAMPWDLYTGLIDKIPMNFRNHALNEKLLIKAQ